MRRQRTAREEGGGSFTSLSLLQELSSSRLMFATVERALTIVILAANVVSVGSSHNDEHYEAPVFKANMMINGVHNTPRFVGSSDFNTFDNRYRESLTLIMIGWGVVGAAMALSIPGYLKSEMNVIDWAKLGTSRALRECPLLLLALGFSLSVSGLVFIDQVYRGLPEHLETLEMTASSAYSNMYTSYESFGDTIKASQAAETSCPALASSVHMTALNEHSNLGKNFSYQFLRETGGYADRINETNLLSADILKLIIFGSAIVLSLGILQGIANWMVSASLCFPVNAKGGTVTVFQSFWSSMSFLLWATTGAVMTVAVASGDFCVDINTGLPANIATNTHAQLSSYYISCEGNNSLKYLADGTLYHTNIALSAIPKLQAESLTHGCDLETVGKDLTSAVSALALSHNSVTKTQPIVLCSYVNPRLTEVFHNNICTDTFKGLMFLWAGLFVISITIVIQVIFYDANDLFLEEDYYDEPLMQNRQHSETFHGSLMKGSKSTFIQPQAVTVEDERTSRFSANQNPWKNLAGRSAPQLPTLKDESPDVMERIPLAVISAAPTPKLVHRLEPHVDTKSTATLVRSVRRVKPVSVEEVSPVAGDAKEGYRRYSDTISDATGSPQILVVSPGGNKTPGRLTPQSERTPGRPYPDLVSQKEVFFEKDAKHSTSVDGNPSLAITYGRNNHRRPRSPRALPRMSLSTPPTAVNPIQIPDEKVTKDDNKREVTVDLRSSTGSTRQRMLKMLLGSQTKFIAPMLMTEGSTVGGTEEKKN